MSAPLRAGLRRLSSLPPSPFSSSLASSLRPPRSSPFPRCASTAVFTDSSYSEPLPDAVRVVSPAELARSSASTLTSEESHRSVLDLYRKLCRLLPQVLKGYELEGEDSYHRGLRNLRFHFEHHRALRERHVVELLRHKAEMEIEEALLMYKTKSHVAALLFEEPQLASVARASKHNRTQPQTQPRLGSSAGSTADTAARQQPSPFLQDFLAGTA